MRTSLFTELRESTAIAQRGAGGLGGDQQRHWIVVTDGLMTALQDPAFHVCMQQLDAGFLLFKDNLRASP